ncbi:MAG: FkbM family methyltransferase [Bacteroidota bacterium]
MRVRGFDFLDAILYSRSQRPITRRIILHTRGAARAAAFARRMGIGGPARRLYHWLFFSRAVRRAAPCGKEASFHTPTPTLAEQVETLTGEGEILAHFLGSLRRGDTVWDAGAGFGLYAVLASVHLGGTGRVAAFEPEPRMRRLLERNASLNACRNLTVHGQALGERDGVLDLFPSDSPNAGVSSSVRRRDYPLGSRPLPVGVRRGDSLVREGVPPPDVLKIDTEGAELSVLRGMGSLLESPRLRGVYCELHPDLLPSFGDTPAAVEEALTGAGFHTEVRARRGTEIHLVCLRERP